MPHALLLSPDDQAVSAITGVLEEMSVTCERPLDGISAAQKLNSQSFDLVLVDCENLPAAKMIFDVCRRGKNGNNPVPIAIVDGRAGLPTAFRLGAELILTKPVSKDQARTTIRTAVGRVQKDVPANKGVAADPLSTAVPDAEMPETGEKAYAAAATASPQLTSHSDPEPSFAPSPVSTAARMADSAAALSTPTFTPETVTPKAVTPQAVMPQAVMPKMHSTLDEITAPAAAPKVKEKPAPFSASSLSESSSAPAVPSKPIRPLVPSDDPVLAELERTELEESERAEAQQAEAKKQTSGQSAGQSSGKSSEPSSGQIFAPAKAAPARAAAESGPPVFSSYQQGRQKPRGSLVALLVLALAAAGFYAAWTYQPGFREIAQPQIDRVLALAGMAQPQSAPPTTPPNPVKPSAQPNAATSSTPAAGSPADSSPTQSQIQAATPDSTTSSSTAAGQPPAAPGTAVAPSAAGTTTAYAPMVAKSEVGKAEVSKPEAKQTESKQLEAKQLSDSKKDAAASLSAPLPGENTAIILSSKGAEKRLAHSVPLKYPASARSAGAEGTVVLKEVVDENGKVAGVRLVEGNAALATAAISAVKQWRYRPYVRDGKAQPFQTVVIIDFQRP